MYKSIFKIMLPFVLLIACSDIPHDNILDPKNPDGYTKPVVLVEAFVNTSEEMPGDFNLWAIEGLDAIETNFDDEVVIVEYHREVSTYTDPYVNTTAYSATDIHTSYTANSPISRGVPDIFVNGAENRVSGASSIATVRDQVSALIQPLLDEKNYIVIEPEILLNGSNLDVSFDIAALSKKDYKNLNARLILVKEYQNDAYAQRVVTGLVKSEILDNLTDGEVVSFAFETITLEENPDRAIIAILADNSTKVLQAIAQEL